MRDAQPRSIRLADYRPPMYLVPRTALHFELYESFTLVHATLQLVRNPAGEQRGPLRLDGEGLELRTPEYEPCLWCMFQFSIVITGL